MKLIQYYQKLVILQRFCAAKLFKKPDVAIKLRYFGWVAPVG